MSEKYRMIQDDTWQRWLTKVGGSPGDLVAYNQHTAKEQILEHSLVKVRHFTDWRTDKPMFAVRQNRRSYKPMRNAPRPTLPELSHRKTKDYPFRSSYAIYRDDPSIQLGINNPSQWHVIEEHNQASPKEPGTEDSIQRAAKIYPAAALSRRIATIVTIFSGSTNTRALSKGILVPWQQQGDLSCAVATAIATTSPPTAPPTFGHIHAGGKLVRQNATKKNRVKWADEDWQNGDNLTGPAKLHELIEHTISEHGVDGKKNTLFPYRRRQQKGRRPRSGKIDFE